MIKLKKNSKVDIINTKQSANTDASSSRGASAVRPEVVNAKVYKVKSAFSKNSVFITLSYVETNSGRRPIEIFINSKDLNRSAEYVVLTRLISAIFRRATDPMFILEELHGIHDPNGGSFKDGKYYLSFYAEVADVIEQFFYDVKIIEKKKENYDTENINEKEKILVKKNEGNSTFPEQKPINLEFKICPTCNNRTLKTENGCDSCVSCGYSKCDK